VSQHERAVIKGIKIKKCTERKVGKRRRKMVQKLINGRDIGRKS
jgi:hypothetical protein